MRQTSAEVIHMVMAAAECRYASSYQSIIEMRILSGTLSWFSPSTTTYVKMSASELGKRDVLEDEGQAEATGCGASVA